MVLLKSAASRVSEKCGYPILARSVRKGGIRETIDTAAELRSALTGEGARPYTNYEHPLVLPQLMQR